ncbi:hypothetical protein RHMOL_Rhmol07G0044900 [Rhododendron molle]|uniref:Uncharacterized protein n=1 Tax=Rhododendron molle TaxID=49168 RepID=A0ACC0MX84_RHOML|nr:hypothetical protein RHMOL_Rhmol07G0044900 [Rhododendron molle]
MNSSFCTTQSVIKIQEFYNQRISDENAVPEEEYEDSDHDYDYWKNIDEYEYHNVINMMEVNFPPTENSYPVEYAFQLFKRKKQSAEFADSMLKLARAFPKMPFALLILRHLIDDMVVYALKGEGCYVWACKNNDGMYRVISCHKFVKMENGMRLSPTCVVGIKYITCLVVNFSTESHRIIVLNLGWNPNGGYGRIWRHDARRRPSPSTPGSTSSAHSPEDLISRLSFAAANGKLKAQDRPRTWREEVHFHRTGREEPLE